MTTFDSKQKPAQRDWHKADIKAALEKAGVKSLRQLSLDHGFSCVVASRAICNPEKGRIRSMERIIADKLSKRPEEIWPSRYPDQ
ncbi:MAG: helix-turn-helix domain-containing protein [Magnetococcales bacterium]|nr:helix-turn-helix domain-containing protein [Magnetococcales bacterium]